MANAAPPASAIRLLLAGAPGLTADLVRRSVVGHADITIVADIRHPDELDATRSVPADVLVTARTAEGIPRWCQTQLFAPDGMPVIAVGSDGRLEIYDRRILREAALDELLVEIRRVATRPAAQGPLT